MKIRQSLRTALGLLALAPLLACSTVGRPAVLEPGPEPAHEPEYPGWSFYEQRAFPFSAPPGGGTEAARKLIAATANSRSAAATADPDAPRWTSLGPSPEIWFDSRTSGRVRAIAIDPENQDILFLGTAQGGVWRTLDGGATWKPLTDGACSLSIGAVAIDPVNPEILYAGTGESPIGSAGFAACGILRSTDRGETWSRLPASVFPVIVPEGFEDPAAEGIAMIYEILIDPRAGNMLLVATSGGLFRSTDSGATFTEVLTGFRPDAAIWDARRDPSNPDIVYAVTDLSSPGHLRTAVFKSLDGGETWQDRSTGLPDDEGYVRAELAIAPSSPDTLYLAVDRGSEPKIYKSTDGAASWVRLEPKGARLRCQCSYDLVIAVSPISPNLVFLGGIPLFVSLDGGSTWSETPVTPHVDYHALVFDKQGRLFAGNDGGVFWTSDRGRNWHDLNTGLEITQFYSVTPHPRDPGILLGGTQDNGTLLFTGRREWQNIYGGDGGKPLVDPVQPSTVYGSAQYAAFNFARSDNGGRTFVRKTDGLTGNEASAFMVPVALKPDHPETLLLATSRVYRTDNRAESWYSIGGSFHSPPGFSPEVYTALAVGSGKPELIYGGSSKGTVRVTNSNGLGWADLSAGLPHRWVTALELDPADSRIVYVTVSGYGSGHVFKGTGEGLGWIDLSSGLPDVPVSDILVLDTVPRTLVVGTDLGVYVSRDDGASWSAFRDGLPNAAVMALGIRPDGSLVAATYGRGMFTAPRLPDPEPAPDPTVLRLGEGGRFEVAVTWRTRDGQAGTGQPVRLTGDTGAFWFFNEKNLEVVVKVLDGCGLNGKFWVFAGGLTDVEVTMTVTDRETGEGKTYHHAAGKPFAPIQDTAALDACPAGASGIFRSAVVAPAAVTSCPPGALCLGENGRFRVEATWKTPAGQSGVAHGVSLTPDTGYLWFFNADNVEVVIKSVDGCGLNGRHWVFAGGLTDVEVELRVTDTMTSEVREYRNPPRQPFQPIQDTGAFSGCL
jgi:photosystem II stability/assembly factor-like uncharacterized protein